MPVTELAVPVACPHYLPVDPTTVQPGQVFTCRGCGAPMAVGPGAPAPVTAGYPGVPSNPSLYEVQ